MVNINHGLYLQGDFVYIHNTGRIKRVIVFTGLFINKDYLYRVDIEIVDMYCRVNNKHCLYLLGELGEKKPENVNKNIALSKG